MNKKSDRQWPQPSRHPAIEMVWHDLLFMHWPVPAADLRALIPDRLAVDTFDGQAWIGIVPFRMTNVGPKGWPKPRWLSDFAELNVRTYVTANDKPGVWFFSLDAAQAIAAWIARRTFSLPYYRADMRCSSSGEGPHGKQIAYASRRTHRGAADAELLANYHAAGPARPAKADTLEYWWTARYCLYAADRRQRLLRGEIDHGPWLLQPAEVELRRCTMTEGLGIMLPDCPPLLHFADRVDVVAWSLDQVG